MVLIPTLIPLFPKNSSFLCTTISLSILSTNDAVNMIMKAKNDFEKGLAEMRDENTQFHTHLQTTVNETTVDKTEFYTEVREFIRYEEFKILIDKLNSLEERLQHRSESAHSSLVTSEDFEEDELGDEVDEFLPDQPGAQMNIPRRLEQDAEGEDEEEEMDDEANDKPPVYPRKAGSDKKVTENDDYLDKPNATLKIERFELVKVGGSAGKFFDW